MPPTFPPHQTPARPATQTPTFHEIEATLPTVPRAPAATAGMVTGPTSGGHRSVDVLRPALTLRGKRGLPRQTLTHRGKRAS